MELVMLMPVQLWEPRPVLGGCVYSYLCDIWRDNLVEGPQFFPIPTFCTMRVTTGHLSAGRKISVKCRRVLTKSFKKQMTILISKSRYNNQTIYSYIYPFRFSNRTHLSSCSFDRNGPHVVKRKSCNVVIPHPSSNPSARIPRWARAVEKIRKVPGPKLFRGWHAVASYVRGGTLLLYSQIRTWCTFGTMRDKSLGEDVQKPIALGGATFLFVPLESSVLCNST